MVICWVILEDSKFVLLYKLHIDYSKIYPSFIWAVLSLEKLYTNVLLKCERCTHFVRYCVYIYIYIYIYIYFFFFFTQTFRLQWHNNLWSIKEDYLRNISVFLFIQWKSLVTKLVWLPTLFFFCLPTFFIISFMFHKRKQVIQVWNDMRVSTWWHNCFFGWTIIIFMFI